MFGRARILATCLVVALAAAGCGGGDDGGAIPSGAERALSMEYETFDGGTATLADYKGTPLVVNFWASSCAPCITEMPDFEAVHKDFDGEVAFVGLTTDHRRSDAEGMVAKTGVTYDLGFDRDEKIVSSFNPLGLPITVLVRADGTIAKSHLGATSQSKLREMIHDELGVEP